MLTKRVDPVYPTEARAKRIQGTVFVEIVIGTDGRVIEAAIKKSVPLLDDATLAAVRQWEYEPAIHSGEPIEVVTTSQSTSVETLFDAKSLDLPDVPC